MIDPQAIIHPSARIAADVEIGPWTLIGADVEIGAGTRVASHVVIKGPTVIGSHNQIFQFSTIGEDTPDLKYKGEATRLLIGDHNVIREGVTIHRGTVQDRGETIIGNHNLLMAYAHVGHDSVIGDRCILVNNASISGHVHIGDWAILSGYVLVHQFCQIGAHAFIGPGTVITKDVPAYMMITGSPAEARNINVEGLKRRGFSGEAIGALRRGYKAIYRQGLTVDEALLELQELAVDHVEVQLLIDSVKNATRGIVR
ncbi:MAG TPA: acyl-ACP--UDP-N-acetylglucosamine O-acyltransferase [Spongiibacteraceae bacterium]|nr:acyl-ACP--UDP-N-acetylglucosamine O-acyltransferase [Spongiibacteraceae bacterium]